MIRTSADTCRVLTRCLKLAAPQQGFVPLKNLIYDPPCHKQEQESSFHPSCSAGTEHSLRCLWLAGNWKTTGIRSNRAPKPQLSGQIIIWVNWHGVGASLGAHYNTNATPKRIILPWNDLAVTIMTLVHRNIHAPVINTSLGVTVLLFHPILHTKYPHPLQMLRILLFPTPSAPTGDALQKQPERSLCGAEIAVWIPALCPKRNMWCCFSLY